MNSAPKSNRKPKVLWILMYHGSDGWTPSEDHFATWRTKKAANWKISTLPNGYMYKPFKYVIGGAE